MLPEHREHLRQLVAEGHHCEQVAADCREEARNSPDPILNWAARMWSHDADRAFMRAEQVRRQGTTE